MMVDEKTTEDSEVSESVEMQHRLIEDIVNRRFVDTFPAFLEMYKTRKPGRWRYDIDVNKQFCRVVFYPESSSRQIQLRQRRFGSRFPLFITTDERIRSVFALSDNIVAALKDITVSDINAILIRDDISYIVENLTICDSRLRFKYCINLAFVVGFGHIFLIETAYVEMEKLIAKYIENQRGRVGERGSE